MQRVSANAGQSSYANANISQQELRISRLAQAFGRGGSQKVRALIRTLKTRVTYMRRYDVH